MSPDELSKNSTAAEAFLRSLASRHRLMVLCTLMEAELSVSELCGRLGLSQSNLSRHLANLRREGLVGTRRERTTIYYRVTSERVLLILAPLHQIFCAPVEEEANAGEGR